MYQDVFCIKKILFLYFKFWEGTSAKSYKIKLLLLFLVSHQFLYQQISFFYNFFELRLALSQKDFCLKFSLFNGFTQTPHTLNSQNLLIATIFLSIFLKMPSDFFLIFAVKILRKHLLCISSELPLYIYFWKFQLPILWCSYQNIFQEPLF